MRFMTKPWLLHAAAAAATVLALGCVTQLGPSEVAGTKLAQGEEFVTGNSKYDEFFASTRNLLSRTNGLQSPVLHRPVAGMLELKDKNDQAATFAAAKERVGKLKEKGSSVFAVLVPEPKLVHKLDGSDRTAPALMNGFENALREGISRARQFEAIAREVDVLDATLTSLEGETGSSFDDVELRASVDRELEAARILLGEARLRADAESGRALRFVVGLAEAVDTGSAEKLASSEAPVAAAPAKKPGGGKLGVRPGGAKPGGAAPAKPAKPKKPAEDFDP
jgi:hypothetical protein